MITSKKRLAIKRKRQNSSKTEDPLNEIVKVSPRSEVNSSPSQKAEFFKMKKKKSTSKNGFMFKSKHAPGASANVERSVATDDHPKRKKSRRGKDRKKVQLPECLNAPDLTVNLESESSPALVLPKKTTQSNKSIDLCHSQTKTAVHQTRKIDQFHSRNTSRKQITQQGSKCKIGQFHSRNTPHKQITQQGQITQHGSKRKLDQFHPRNTPCKQKIQQGQITHQGSKNYKVESLADNSSEISDCSEDEGSPENQVTPLKTPGFCWNADVNVLAKIIEPSNASESSGDEDDDMSKKKKKRQTVSEKREAAKKEEERLRAVEESLASNTNLPSSCDEFDRALLSNPDSSELWLQYMAFHLQATEIEKARAVAQRALKTISYRKEQEKFNVWVGLLNLENLYGTQETLKKTLAEALQLNDAYKVRIQMINIFAENGKLQELESEIKVVSKKFRDVHGMWLEIGSILYKYGHIEHARRLLQQSLGAQRNKNDTVGLISRFAMMEAKFGEMERALALFDSILVSHPQRVDVWSMCIDQLCKAGMVEQARSTLDRAISQKLKARWMKILFAKYLTFEEKYGTPEGSERVREKAREYVERVSGSTLKE